MASAKRVEGDEGNGRYRVVIEPTELAMLKSLPKRLTRVLSDPSRAHRVIDRLFPPVHTRDAAAEAEYRKLMGDALIERRQSSLREFKSTLKDLSAARAPVPLELDEAGLDLWLHVINDMRLLLATELDIQDNEWSLIGPRKPDDLPDFSLLIHLSDIQQVLIDVLEP